MALKAATRPSNAAARPRAYQAQAEDMRSVPLDLAPLVAPYRSQTTLALRVERMQQHSRLSRGRNNGDRSWSLRCDELDGLQYLVREDALEEHSLSVRVVDIEQQGSTLAVLDVPVRHSGKPASAPTLPGSSTPATSDRDMKSLKSEVEKLKSEIAERDRKLAQRTDELAAAQENTRTQLQEQLAATNGLAALALEEKLKQWHSERDALIAGNETAAEQMLAAARAQWEREAKDAALAAANRSGEDRLRQMEEAGALATTRAEKAEAALAAVNAQRAAEGTRHAEMDRARQDELSKALAEMTARAEQSDAALFRANSDIARIEREMRAEIDALNAASATRTGEEAARLATAEQVWKKQADKIAAELTARCARAEADGAIALREAAAKTALVELKLRDELSVTTENLRQREAALGDAHAQIARYANDATQHDRTRAELIAARTELADRTPAASSAPSATGAAAALEAAVEQGIQVGLADALGRAKMEWEKSEAVKLSALEAKMRARSEAALSDAEARAREAEQVVATLRAEMAHSVHNHHGGREIAQLHDQITSLQTDLAIRESELARLNQIVRENQLYAAGRAPRESGEEEAQAKPTGRLVRDLVVVAVLVVVPVILFPHVEPMLPYSWQYQIDTTMAQIVPNFGSSLGQQTAPEPAKKTTARPVSAPEPKAVVARSARLHAGPKSSSVTLSVISSGTGVAVLRKDGNWTMVRAGNIQGWIFDTYLKEAPKPKTGN
ncbi:MAG TPA: hypothetical protein VGH02_13490 [Rhizomicrobium sp.]|jgi:hypothetical protein